MSRRKLERILEGTGWSVSGVKKYSNNEGVAYFYRGNQALNLGKKREARGTILGNPSSFSDVAESGAKSLEKGEAYEIQFLSKGRIGKVKSIYPRSHQ